MAPWGGSHFYGASFIKCLPPDMLHPGLGVEPHHILFQSRKARTQSQRYSESDRAYRSPPCWFRKLYGKCIGWYSQIVFTSASMSSVQKSASHHAFAAAQTAWDSHPPRRKKILNFQKNLSATRFLIFIPNWIAPSCNFTLQMFPATAMSRV